MKKILFCCYGGGHVQSLLPLIEHFRNDPNYKVTILALTTAQKTLADKNIDFLGYKDLVTSQDLNILQLGTSLAAQLELLKINREETIAYLGANMQELIEVHGSDQAEKMYAEGGRAVFFPLRVMLRFLEKEKPDLVVATNSPRSERAIIEAATILKIPALCIVDGFAKHEISWICSPNFGKYVCVFGASVKDNLINLGRPSEDIHITGNPAFDSFIEPVTLESIAELKRKLSINERQKVILYAPSPEGYQHIFTKKPANAQLPRDILDELLKIAQEQKDVFLIIRPHPSQGFDLKNIPENVYYDINQNLKDIISVSDIVVVLASTVGIQAQMMGKTLICCNQSVYADDIDYEDFGKVERVNSIKELEKSLIAHINIPLSGSNLDNLASTKSAKTKIIDLMKQV